MESAMTHEANTHEKPGAAKTPRGLRTGVDTSVHSRSTTFEAGGEHAHQTFYAAYVERLKREHECKASFWSSVR
jgi:hypothetical protein